MYLPKFSIQNGYVCLPSIESAIEDIKDDINELGVSYGNTRHTSFSTSNVDAVVNKINRTEQQINELISYYSRNGNKAVFDRVYSNRNVDFFDPANFLNSELRTLNVIKSKVEFNYMQAASNDLPVTISQHQLEIDEYIDNSSDSEVEALENALEYIKDGLREADRHWKQKQSWKNRAAIGAKYESLKFIKKEVKSRLKEARKFESKLERMEAQIEQIHGNRMQQLEWEREIEEKRLKRQREAQQDMDNLMNKFYEILTDAD